MPADTAISELAEFAKACSDGDLTIHEAVVTLDERQDGEAVTRVQLLVSDPSGDTWDVDRIRELRLNLGRKAAELDLPPVSITLVAKSEIEATEVFAR